MDRTGRSISSLGPYFSPRCSFPSACTMLAIPIFQLLESLNPLCLLPINCVNRWNVPPDPEMFEEGARLKTIHGEDQVHDFSLGNPILEPPQVHRHCRKFLVNPLLVCTDTCRMPVWANPGLCKELNKETGLNSKPRIRWCVSGRGVDWMWWWKPCLIRNEVLTPFPFLWNTEPMRQITEGCWKPWRPPTPFSSLEAFDAALNPNKMSSSILTILPEWFILNSPWMSWGYWSGKKKGIWHHYTRSRWHLLSWFSMDWPAGMCCWVIRIDPCPLHSKDLGLPGERIGFAVHPGIPERETTCQGLALATGFSARQCSCPDAADSAIDGQQPWRFNLQKLRDRFYEMLTDLGFEVVLPRGAFYLFPKSPEADDVAFVRGLSRKGSSWYQGRVSVGLGISGSQSAAARRTSNDHDPVRETRGPLWSQKMKLRKI